MDRNDTLPRSIDRPVLGRWGSLGITVLIAVGSYFLVAGFFIGCLRAEILTFCGIGNIERAKQRIAHCKTKQEIRAILGKPAWQNDNDSLWEYYSGAPLGDRLHIIFDPHGRPIEMRTCIS